MMNIVLCQHPRERCKCNRCVYMKMNDRSPMKSGAADFQDAQYHRKQEIFDDIQMLIISAYCEFLSLPYGSAEHTAREYGKVRTALNRQFHEQPYFHTVDVGITSIVNWYREVAENYMGPLPTYTIMSKSVATRTHYEQSVSILKSQQKTETIKIESTTPMSTNTILQDEYNEHNISIGRLF